MGHGATIAAFSSGRMGAVASAMGDCEPPISRLTPLPASSRAAATAPALVNLSSRTTSSTWRLSTPPFSFHWPTATLAPASQAAPASAPMPLIGSIRPMRMGPLWAKAGRVPTAPSTAAAAVPWRN